MDFADRRAALNIEAGLYTFVFDISLENYYRMLTYLVINEQLLQEIGSGIFQLRLLLNCYDGTVSLLSSIGLNHLQRMYFGTDSYFRKAANPEYNRNIAVKQNRLQKPFKYATIKTGRTYPEWTIHTHVQKIKWIDSSLLLYGKREPQKCFRLQEVQHGGENGRHRTSEL